MKIESHKANLKESLKEIENAVKAGLEEKQRTVGFHTSAACVDMFEIYLHKLSLLSWDSIIKHEWFLSKRKIEEKVPFDFPGRSELIEMIRGIEMKRNNLCYGKRRTFEELATLVEDFNKVKKKFEALGITIEDDEDEKK
jgi:hypothetical protein